MKGLVYERKHLTDRSIEEFNRAIKLNPKFADAFYDRGRAYDWKEQYLLAIKDYDQAIKLNSKHANAIKHRELTIILKRIDDRKIKRLPKDAEGGVERGQVYMRNTQFDLAIKDFSHSIELASKPRNVYYYRGKAYLETGQFDLAIKDFNNAIKY